jgi:hypothetical protein
MIRQQIVSFTPLTIIRVAYKKCNQYANNFTKINYLITSYNT